MKLLAALLLIGATSAPAFAGPATGYRSRGGYAEQEKCFRKEYREEYVPGTMNSPGYVRTYKKRECELLVKHQDQQGQQDHDMCLSLLLVLTIDMKTHIPTWVVWIIIPVSKVQ